MKTKAEIDELKRNWSNDPIWDIEETEGFDDHWEELHAFSVEMMGKWDAQYKARQAEEKAQQAIERANAQPTRRDIFAAAALQGLLASANQDALEAHEPRMAHYAFLYADAMLAESDKQESDQ